MQNTVDLEKEIDKILPKDNAVTREGFLEKNGKLLLVIILILTSLVIVANIYVGITLPKIYERVTTLP